MELVAEDDEDDRPLHGFRRGWQAMRPDSGDAASTIELDPDESTPSASPVIIHDTSVPEPVGAVCPMADSEAAVAHQFLSNMKLTDIVMPWEEGPLKAIFSDEGDLPPPSLSMPSSWNLAPSKTDADSSQKVELPSACPGMALCSSVIKSIKDTAYLDDRANVRARAVNKWLVILNHNLNCSRVGLQISYSPDDSTKIIDAVLGTKSPHTVIGRANAFLSFMRWSCTMYDSEKFLPVSEDQVWKYMTHLRDTDAPATRAASFVQSLRFAHYVFGLSGCQESFTSRRICGLSEIMLAGKKVTRQSRPLTVAEVRMLHGMAADPSVDCVDRVISSHCLMMIYGRCRHSDTVQVESIIHDHADNTGYVQVNTRYHKGNKTVAKKNLLLPVLIPAAGVGGRPWAESWWESRTEASLPTAGEINGPLLPAPLGGDKTRWAKRPVTCSELTGSLRVLLGQQQDELLTSHSLKTTVLSWAAKGEMQREHRRLLGRHSSTIAEADSVYSRDLCYPPVKALESLLTRIRKGSFVPDAPRTFFDGAVQQPATVPASPSVLPLTPRPERLFAAAVDSYQPHECETPQTPSGSVKSEWSCMQSNTLAVPLIEVSSSSESDTSDCDEDGFSSDSSEQQVGHLVDRQSKAPRLGEKMVRHSLTKTIHLVADNFDSDDTTQCGRTINAKMAPVDHVRDWPHKCRVCFRGRRAP